MNKGSLKLNLGCGTSIADGWVNVDCSPNLLLAKLPFYGVIKKILFNFNLMSEKAYKARWTSNILYCNLIKSFPSILCNSCSEVYSSHFIEHIPHEKAFILLKKCYEVLQPGGVFRVAVPDLYTEAKLYVEKIEKALKEGYEEPTASEEFIRLIALREKRHSHLWMYDFFSLSQMLQKAGFTDIKKMLFRQSKIKDINLIENREDSVFIESTKV